MKNFTFLIIIMLISCVLSAENSSELQKKIQLKHKNISEMTQRYALLNNLLNFTGSEAALKSAAVTQKLDSTVSWILNTETQLWQYDYKDEFLYDSEMKNTKLHEKEWNNLNSTWDNTSIIELGYDNSDRINSMLMNEVDSLTKFLIFYNATGMQDSVNLYSLKMME